MENVYTSREAASLWGLAENTVTMWCNRGKFDEGHFRKSGKVWLVSHEGMVKVTGREPGQKKGE